MAPDPQQGDGRCGVGKALYWKLLSQEDVQEDPDDRGRAGSGADQGDAGGGRTAGGSLHLVEAGGDLFVFEAAGPRRSRLRRFIVAENAWRAQVLDIPVHAAVTSPRAATEICLLSCSPDWNSDHRYKVYAWDTANAEQPHIDTRRSRLVDAGIAPKKRHGFSVAPHGGCIYFFCGLQHFPGDATGSFVYCFSLDERAWSEVEYQGVFPAPFPQAPYIGCRFGQSCVVHEGKAWIYGGCAKQSKGMQPTNQLFSFDLQEHRWEEVKGITGDLQLPRLLGHASLVCHGRVLVFGGDGSAQEVFGYEVATGTWERLPPLMLGPRPADGRILCCSSKGRLIAYQQQRDAAARPGDAWRHELFSIDADEVFASMAEGPAPEGLRLTQELDLLEDETTADVFFSVEGRIVPAHRAVLERFAPALARLCACEVEEVEEGEVVLEKPVRLADVRHDAFCALLEHVYSRFTRPLEPRDAEVLLEPAHQFELTTLSRMCQEAIVVDASNVRTLLTLALAAKPPLEALPQKCMSYLTLHPEHLSLVKGPGRTLELPELQLPPAAAVAAAAAAAVAAATAAAARPPPAGAAGATGALGSGPEVKGDGGTTAAATRPEMFPQQLHHSREAAAQVLTTGQDAAGAAPRQVGGPWPGQVLGAGLGAARYQVVPKRPPFQPGPVQQPAPAPPQHPQLAPQPLQQQPPPPQHHHPQQQHQQQQPPQQPSPLPKQHPPAAHAQLQPMPPPRQHSPAPLAQAAQKQQAPPPPQMAQQQMPAPRGTPTFGTAQAVPALGRPGGYRPTAAAPQLPQSTWMPAAQAPQYWAPASPQPQAGAYVVAPQSQPPTPAPQPAPQPPRQTQQL